MGLQRQVVPVQLGQGLDTKTDKKHVVPGKLLVLENCVFKKRNRLDKRNGYRAISRKLVDGTDLPDGTALEVFNDELLHYADQNLYSYSAGADRWVDKGAVTSAIVRTRQVIKNTASQTQTDSATNGGVSVYAWEDSRGGVRACVVDEVSGATLLDDTVLDASASRVRCLAFSAYLYVFYYKAGGLYVRRINPASPTAFETAVTVSTNVNTTDPTYDVLAYGEARILWVINAQSATKVVAGWLDDAPAVLTGSLGVTDITAEAATRCLSVILGPGQDFYVGWSVGATVRCTIRNNSMGEVQAAFTVDAVAALNMTGYPLSDDTGVRWLYEVSAAATYNRYVAYTQVTRNATVGTPTVFMRSVGLSTKAFYFENADQTRYYYVGLVHDSVLQATYFVARDDAVIIAKQQATVAGGVTTRPILANVWQPETGVYAWAILNKVQLVSENATIYTPTGVARTSLNFTSQDVFTAAQLGKNLHVVGGVLQMYDGQSVVEHGFHLYPENLSAAQSGAAGVADGAYQYVAVYEWTDNFGQVHRSAPSVALSFTVTGGPRNVTVTVPTLRITAKQGTRSHVSVVLYRTEAAGELFYRVTSVSSPTLNVPTADTVDIVDTTTDATLITHEILYSTGGVLEHFAPPACSAITTWQNRVVLAGLEAADDVWFSKEFKNDGEAVAFNDELKKTVKPEGGGLTAVAALDEKLLVFKADRFLYTAGSGPNNAGQLGDFGEPTENTSNIGTANAQSIVKVPAGIMVETAKGLYLIDGQLAPAYIGDEVEDYNDLTITSAVHVSDLNQVRFTTSDGVCLVYDYYFRQWSTFTAHEAVDAVLWRGVYVMLKVNGQIWKEDTSYHKDAGSPIRVKIGTGWLALASVVGLQRIYRIALLGEYLSPHRLHVHVGYDYSPAFSDVIPFLAASALDAAAFGDGAVYGGEADGDEVYGGVNNAERFVAHLRIQKCQAIRLLIEERTTAATEGSQEGFNITTLGLLAGIKAGMGKFRAKQNLGTT